MPNTKIQFKDLHCKLTVDVKLDLVPLYPVPVSSRNHTPPDPIQRLDSPLQHPHHLPQPRDMPLLQIPHRPYISPLDQRKEVQTPQRLPIPIQIRQQQEPLIPRRISRTAVQDILLLGPALDDVEDPVQLPRLAVLAHVRPDVGAVDRCRLEDGVEALGRVFLDVAGRAGVDQVELEIGWWWWCGAV